MSSHLVLNTTFKKTFLVYGLKRSGNHAIINWIAAQDRFYIINNIYPIAPILRGEMTIPDPQTYDSLIRNYTPPRFSRPVIGAIKRYRHNLLISLEDHELTVSPLSNSTENIKTVLILRSPSNLFASRIRKASMVDNPAYTIYPETRLREVVSLWKMYAREFLGQTHILRNKVCIYFDGWIKSQDYRQRVAHNLGIEWSDRGLEKVSPIGGGSSFDGTAFDKSGQEMQVLDRTTYLNDQEAALLDSIINDPEVADLWKHIEDEVINNQKEIS